MSETNRVIHLYIIIDAFDFVSFADKFHNILLNH